MAGDAQGDAGGAGVGPAGGDRVVRVVGTVLLLAGILELGWALALGLQVVPRVLSGHHPVLWGVLDIAEAVGLLLSGWGLRRRTAWAGVACSVTAALLVVDAWFDVMLSQGNARTWAIVAAGLVEIPAAVVLAWAARRSLRGMAATTGDTSP